MESLWNELKRRNVVRVGVAYALVAWVALQVIDFALEVISAPHWILQVIALLAAIGFPAVLVFAWVYEMTPEGLKRETEVDRSRWKAAQHGTWIAGKTGILYIGCCSTKHSASTSGLGNCPWCH